MLTGRGIRKRYQEVQVLKGVDISIDKGEVVSIIGPSGAGKSTLLHILGTLEPADEGVIEIMGESLGRMNDRTLSAFRNRHIGFVFQFHHLLPEFTALENVCIPAWIAGTGRKAATSQATDLLSMLGLSDRLHHKPSQLSGGEQQRVSVARALINRPAIIMADEPTGNLDSVHALELHRLFIDLARKMGHTFLIVTHNDELARMSDRILRMSDGCMQG